MFSCVSRSPQILLKLCTASRTLVTSPRSKFTSQLCSYPLLLKCSISRQPVVRNTMSESETGKVYDQVKEYYGKILQSRDDLKTGACIPPGKAMSKHLKDAMALVHPDVEARYYGCGLVIPDMLQGMKILDLGSGSGRDCFILSKLVGENGHVTGLDMTDEQLDVANKFIDHHTSTFGYKKANVNFVKGYIEKLIDAGLDENYFDIVISNCVVNLSPDKRAVLSETYKVLKEGGELYFSDVYCDRQLSPEIRKHEVLWGECIAGALAWNELFELTEEIGFSRPRLMNVSPVPVEKQEFKNVLGDANFCSATYRLFKLPKDKKERTSVVYNGDVEGNPNELKIDHRHTFKVQDIVSVDSELATILSTSRFKDAFDIQPAPKKPCCVGGCPDTKLDDPFEFLSKMEAKGTVVKPACCSTGSANKCC